MFATNFRRQVATVLCTVLMSSACVLGAVGPAEAGAGHAVVAKAARLVA
jgi:hypothetical protein